jgi:outer membrane protein OmpA-like peptidoglycan-associated protein
VKGDFSRDTFQRQHHFSRVLMQQGRVLLDSDWNEQTSILLHYLRALAADLIGQHGGPGDGFKILCSDDYKCDFSIARGHYYVDGILCENLAPPMCPPDDDPAPLTYTSQADFPLMEDDEEQLERGASYLVYLDVWERHLTHLVADHIREVALGGPDTASRAQIVCQVKVAREDKDTPTTIECAELLDTLVLAKQQAPRCLRARARVESPSDDPCIIPPEARYRGAENQLYRVEIHDSGTAGATKQAATFKWSRDNGSVIFAIRTLQGSIVGLETLGPDDRHSLKAGDWVEIVNDVSVLRFAPRGLVKVKSVDRIKFEVTLDVPEGIDLPVFDESSTTHPLLRRWDQGSDSITVQESKWIDLEDGVQIYFEAGGYYRSGDYWLVPARTATGDVLWPTVPGPDGIAAPQPLPPNGIEHHYAPLARIALDQYGNVSCRDECRCSFTPLCGAMATPSPSSDQTLLNQVFFKKNSAALTDESLKQLTSDSKRLADSLSRNPMLRTEIRGLATPDENKPSELAKERANGVLNFYVENGIDSANLSAVVSDTSVAPTGSSYDQPSAETVLLSKGASRSPANTPVNEVEGVGETFALRLGAAGITHAGDIVPLQPVELAKILSPQSGRTIATSRAEAIIKDAKRLVEVKGDK